jgi:hypothetical protein
MDDSGSWPRSSSVETHRSSSSSIPLFRNGEGKQAGKKNGEKILGMLYERGELVKIASIADLDGLHVQPENEKCRFWIPRCADDHKSQPLDESMGLGEPFHTPEISPRSDPMALSRSGMHSHLLDALGLLLQAYDYAVDVGQEPWDLAVELYVLRAAHVTNSDLRWLAAKGYIEHAIETTVPDDVNRHFRRVPQLTFSDVTCVVLTRTGAAVAREARSGDSVIALPKTLVSICDTSKSDDLPRRPKWDHQRRQLRVGTSIVKEFKLPSPNQETILTAFEEECWPPQIDDPLSPAPPLDPRRRLHDTIKALNRNQKHGLIRFRGDGSGEGIRWEFTIHDGGARPSSMGAE